MKASSRTCGVIAGGTAGFLVGGPIGAVTGGVLAGTAIDGITTGVESAINHEYTPSGNIAMVTKIVNGETDSVSGDIFDMSFGIVMDGMTGYVSGKYWGRKI